jgi:hypothetical protein
MTFNVYTGTGQNDYQLRLATKRSPSNAQMLDALRFAGTNAHVAVYNTNKGTYVYRTRAQLLAAMGKLTPQALPGIDSLTSEELREAFRVGGYTYDVTDVRGAELGKDICPVLGTTKEGALQVAYRFKGEEGIERGTAYVTVQDGHLKAEH